MALNSNLDRFGPRQLKLAHSAKKLTLGPKAHIMGILNVTPDSFSDGGQFDGTEQAVTSALSMIEAGASIIDIGGESTRPGAQAVDAAEEQKRVLPVIEALRAVSDCIISIDTYRAETAKLAVHAGANMINDVWGAQREPEIAAVAGKTGSALCLMHSGRNRDILPDVIDDQLQWFKASLDIAKRAGVQYDQIVLDPGFGFAKDTEMNIELLRRLSELHQLDFPLLIGTSRKRFIGAVTEKIEASQRDIGTAATSFSARMDGGAIFRVHDVVSNKDALLMADAMIASVLDKDI